MRFTGNEAAAIFSTYLSIIALAAISTALLLLFIKVWRLTRDLNPESV
jgi:hypothetical protein